MGKREWDTIFLAEFMENDNTLLSWGLIGGGVVDVVRGVSCITGKINPLFFRYPYFTARSICYHTKN